MDIAEYWGVVFIIVPVLAAVIVALRRYRRSLTPGERYKSLTHSNATAAVKYDSAAFIQNGGMNQYPTDSGPVFPNRLSIEFEEKHH